jgi:hypothetical protein
MLSSATSPAAGRVEAMPLNGDPANPRLNGTVTWPHNGQGITISDWDVMFDAVRARLLQAVGERLGELPKVPQHSAELSASLVQAVILDCVIALDQLHAALQQERSQRPTS